MPRISRTVSPRVTISAFYTLPREMSFSFAPFTYHVPGRAFFQPLTSTAMILTITTSTYSIPTSWYWGSCYTGGVTRHCFPLNLSLLLASYEPYNLLCGSVSLLISDDPLVDILQVSLQLLVQTTKQKERPAFLVTCWLHSGPVHFAPGCAATLGLLDRACCLGMQ